MSEIQACCPDCGETWDTCECDDEFCFTEDCLGWPAAWGLCEDCLARDGVIIFNGEDIE